MFNYQAFGIPILSEIELPALLLLSSYNYNKEPIVIKMDKVSDDLQKNANVIKPFSKFNDTELRFELPDTLKMYVSNGKNIVIQLLDQDIEQSLIYVYARGLTAALLQRNLLVFHVSGIFLPNGQVVLFAAPSRTGKSTTAIKLSETGYKLFTDDTALIEMENGKCLATASYPMTRLWQNTLDHQLIYDSSGKKSLHYENEKYGFDFHDQFVSDKVEVAAIVFLNETGTEIEIKKITVKSCFENLMLNIYNFNWLKGMKKQHLPFNQLSQIANQTLAFTANRPKNKKTFDDFAQAIETQILKQL